MWRWVSGRNSYEVSAAAEEHKPHQDWLPGKSQNGQTQYVSTNPCQTASKKKKKIPRQLWKWKRGTFSNSSKWLLCISSQQDGSEIHWYIEISIFNFQSIFNLLSLQLYCSLQHFAVSGFILNPISLKKGSNKLIL